MNAYTSFHEAGIDIKKGLAMEATTLEQIEERRELINNGISWFVKGVQELGKSLKKLGPALERAHKNAIQKNEDEWEAVKEILGNDQVNFNKIMKTKIVGACTQIINRMDDIIKTIPEEYRITTEERKREK